MRSLIPTKAFIFAAGLGTRMRPLTEHKPKPLIEVNGKPMLDYQMEMLISAGIKEIGINCFYLADQIEGHLQKYLQSGVNIKIFLEEERLETGGGLLNAMSFINYEPIITLNADVIFKYEKNPVNRLINNWHPEKYDLLMLLSEKEKAIGYYEDGNFNVDDQGMVIKDNDRPYIYTGLQIINTEVLKKYSHKKIFSLSEVFTDLSQRKRISALIHDNYWLHIGDMKGLEDCEKFLNCAF